MKNKDEQTGLVGLAIGAAVIRYGLQRRMPARFTNELHRRSLVKTEGLSTLTAYAVKTEVKMTDRPVHGDHPDYNPSPDNPEKDGRKPKDDPGSAPESGDKDPE